MLKKWLNDKFLFNLYLISCISVIMMWLVFEYIDFDSMTAWTMNIWDIIFSKELTLFDFYTYTGENIHGAWHDNCAGNYLWIVPWCLWNFPLWILTKIFDITLVTGNYWCLCYSKLYLVLGHIAVAHITYLIVKKLGGQINLYFIPLLILASPEILISAEYAGQDEVVYLYVLLAAVYFCISKKWNGCYVCCIVTVSMCPIMIIPVTAIILCKEKDIIKIVLYEIGLLIPTVVFEMIYHKDILYQSLKGIHSITSLGQEMLSTFVFSIGEEVFSVSLILCIFIYFYCYIQQDIAEKDLIYLLTALMVDISFLMHNFYYRFLLYVPFLIVVIAVANPHNMDMNMFLFSILTYGRMLCFFRTPARAVMNTSYVMKNSWITWLCDKIGNDNYLQERYLYLYIYGSKWKNMIALLSASVSIACILLLLYMNKPNEKRNYQLKLNYRVSMVAYVMSMPLVLLVFFKMLWE